MARRARGFEFSDDERKDDALPASGLVATLVDLAGARSFQAGRDYFRDGAVREWEVEGRELTGLVSGTDDYEVELQLTIDGMGVEEYLCDCPYHEDHGAFCKHCVALGLAFATSGQNVPKSEKKREPKKDLVAEYLNALEKPALIERLLTAAREDRSLRQKLELEAAANGPREAQATAMRKALSSALYVREFLEYYEGRAWARNAEGVIDRLHPLLKTDPTLAIELSEFALEKLEQALERADDSNGEIGALLQSVQELHLRACIAAKPDPVALAQRLWDWEKKSPWETFYGAAETYADALGARGLAEYHRLLKAEWDRLPALKPGERDRHSGRFRLTHAMAAHAKANNNLDGLIEIYSKDLSGPHDFLRIAQTLLDAKRGDEALAWAERGWQSFSEPSQQLAEFLIARYSQRKRHDEAIGIAWRLFESQPSARLARLVKATAESTERWPELRERIVGSLRPDPQRKPKRGYWVPNEGSELVRFHLDDGDADAAWSAAQAHSCTPSLWLQLAEKRVKTVPDDAVMVWKRIAESQIDAMMGRYAEPVELLGKLAKRLSRTEFGDYVAALRVRFKRKRNFIKELDERGF